MTHVAEGGISGSTGTTYGSSGPGGQSGTAQTAKEQASGVAQGAAEAGRSVAQEAKSEAAGVAQAAGEQAKNLLGEARTQLTSQTKTGQGKVAGTVRQFGEQLGQMADAPEQGGVAADVVREVSTRVSAFAERLEGSEPSELLDDLRRYASRHPGTFLVAAGAAGLLLGRLTRGIKDVTSDSTPASGLPRGDASTATYGVVGGTTGLAADDLGYGGRVVPEVGPVDSPYTSPEVAGTTGAATGTWAGPSTTDPYTDPSTTAGSGTAWPSTTGDRP
ncbi:hypothetical protein [Cellulomonas endophytica]|uniref:hypothetical protein n=1 Tax=Cellulomonas endophytica TaxID=2494735 RepID=UPI0010107B04|nr:hypothetical protein [Cellulomonas endophytica]